MRRILIAGFLALGLISAAVPAARALDPDALRQDVIAALNRGLTGYRTGPFLFTGVETAVQGAAVRVEIGDLTLPLPDQGGRIEFGDLAFNLADGPAGSLAGDRRYLVSEVTTASRVAIIDETGEKIAFVNYDLESLSGVWSTAVRNFLDIDMAVAQIEAVVPKEDLGFAIDRITAVNQTVTGGDGLMDIEGEARAIGLRIIKSGAGTVRIGEILVEIRGHGYDMAGALAFNEAIEEVIDHTTPLDRNRIAAILERLESVNMLGQGLIERFKVTDLNFVDENKQPRFHLDEMEFDMAGGDLHLALGYGSLGMRLTGAQMVLPGSEGNGADTPLQALTPENLGLIVSVERFPVQVAWRSLLNVMLISVAAGEQGPDPDAMGMVMGAEILDAINEAGTILRLDRLDVEAPSSRLQAEGKFHADPATAIGVRGHLDLNLTGLDEFIAAITDAGQSGQVAPEVQDNMMFLYMLKGMARREPGPDGKPVDRLEIVLTPAGEVLLNGQPFSMGGPQ